MGACGQVRRIVPAVSAGKVLEAIIPNPKLKLMVQVREVMRLKHYSLRTERCDCDWIRRYVKFRHMRSREELFGGVGKAIRAAAARVGTAKRVSSHAFRHSFATHAL